jgi:hypothetical protein
MDTTRLLIVFFSIAVWRSKGFYFNWAVWLVLVFFAWSCMRIFRPAKSAPPAPGVTECLFYWVYPSISALLIAVNPNFMYAGASLGLAILLFRMAPILLNVISSKIMPFCVLVFFISVLFLSPDPGIDVFRSNSLGVKFLLHGLDPYSQKYPDIYHGQFDYHPGFLYWPGALLLQTISKLICRDVRAVLVLAWWLAALFFPRSHPHFRALRKIWWFVPVIPYALEQGWLDPLLSLAAAMTLWAMRNKRWWLMALAIALASSIKQYGFIIGLFPLGALALERQWKTVPRVGLASLVVFLVVVGPFLIWDPHGFLIMTINEHLSAASRTDSLNFTSFWVRAFETPFPAWAQLAMILYGFALAIFHLVRNYAPGRLAVIAESWAMAFGFAMLFGKFAFCNYYWLLISFLILSLAFEQSREVEFAMPSERFKPKKQIIVTGHLKTR